MKNIFRAVSTSLILCGALCAEESISVGGDVAQPLTLTKDDLAKMPRVSMAVPNEQGVSIKYEGVLLYEVLKRAGAPIDKQLSGKGLASYLLAEAHDGYAVVFTLTETDPQFTEGKILVADAADGKPLGEKQGPFKLVVPNEKKGSRSIRMLERITVVRLRK